MWDIRGPGIKDHKNISKIPVESTFILARLNNNFGVGFRDHENINLSKMQNS